MSVQSEKSSAHRPVRHFVRHYLEMLVAMTAGMVVLTPLWELGLGVAGASWLLERTEPATLVMATSMSVPMVAWMRYRGHGWPASIEMSLSMFVPTFAAIALLAAGLVTGIHALLSIQHIAMLPSMLVAMLARRDEYTHSHAEAHA